MEDIPQRAQEKFSWFEFGYISAKMYRFARPDPADEGIGAMLDMQTDFIAGSTSSDVRMRRFQEGWNLGIKHWRQNGQNT